MNKLRSLAPGLILSLLLIGCNGQDSAQENLETPPKTSIDEPVEKAAEPTRPISSRQEPIRELAISLDLLSQQLQDSLEYTHAPAEVQEELLLSYQQLSNRARQAHSKLQRIIGDSLRVGPGNSQTIKEAKELEAEIEAFLLETSALY